MNVAPKGLWMLWLVAKGIGGILKRAWAALRWQRTARNSGAFLESVRESGRRVHPEAANPLRKPEENVAVAVVTAAAAVEVVASAASSSAATVAAPSRRARWRLRILGWGKAAWYRLLGRRAPRGGETIDGATPVGRRHAMIRVADVLMREIYWHHDPCVQAQMVGGNCNLVVRYKRLNLFGVVTLSSDFTLSWRLRSTKVVPPSQCDEVARLFAAENRRHPSSRWHVGARTGEIEFGGEVKLHGDPQRDLRLARRHLFRRIEVMKRRFTRLAILQKDRVFVLNNGGRSTARIA